MDGGVKTDKKFTKLVVNHLQNAKGFFDYGIEHGLTTAADVRLTIAKRQETAKALIEGGMSQRQAAKVLGVSQSTIRDDVRDPSSKHSESEQKILTTKAERQEAYAASVEGGCTVAGLDELIAAGKQFTTIYADPPWLYDNQGTRAATKNHYAGMTVDQICGLPIKQLAADDAQLHLWTTNGFLFECPRVFAAWGFEFKSSFIWVKPQIGIGNYWRNAHEFLLTAVRGNAKRFSDKNLKSWSEFKRGEHSAKPVEVREFIERASADPRRIELFARGAAAPGWIAWGNEIDKDLFQKQLGAAE